MIQIDEIGVIYAAIPADAPEDFQPEALPGWHVNATAPVPGWEAQQVHPETPRRTFGSIPTTFYTFADKDEFDAAMEVADLTEPPPVPQSLPVLQCLLAIDAAGMAPAYKAWADSPERTFAQRAFIDRAQNWSRNDPTLTAASEALGLTDEDLDNLFRLGVTL